jgi:glutaconate CoA-transferase subunit B
MADPPSLHETIAVVIARSLRDGDVGFTGLTTGEAAAMFGTMIPLAAMELARHLHAPRLTCLLAGWCHNPSICELDHVPDSEFDPALLALPCDDLDMGWPAQISIKRGDVTVGFCSGAQVDREGNLNTVRIGRAERPDVQLVGPILIPEHLALFGREIVMIPRHDTRTLVDHVDHLSGVGFPGGRSGREVLGLPGSGPEMIVTPKCIFGFDDDGVVFVRSVHQGVTASELRENTGFSLDIDDSIPRTPVPDDEELLVLRRDVDPHGLLRR